MPLTVTVDGYAIVAGPILARPLPLNLGDFGVEDLDRESIVRVDDRVPLDLGIGGLVFSAVPVGTNLDLGREVAARAEASLVPLSEEKDPIADRNPATPYSDAPTSGLSTAGTRSSEGSLILVGRPLPAVRIPGQDECRHSLNDTRRAVFVPMPEDVRGRRASASIASLVTAGSLWRDLAGADRIGRLNRPGLMTAPAIG